MGWKIVRDNDPEVCPKLGVSGVWRESKDPIGGLTKKLFEEAAEFAESRDVEELYDLEDVVLELIARLDPENRGWRRYMRKIAERGVFKKGIEWNPVPNSPSQPSWSTTAPTSPESTESAGAPCAAPSTTTATPAPASASTGTPSAATPAT